MKANKISIKIVVIALILALTAGFCAAAYAFFTSEWYKQLTGQVDNGNVTVKEISSYDQLFAASIGDQGAIFNDKSPVSSNACALTLTKDVTLDNDLIVSADVHLNLNGHTLYLDGHTLSFMHAYHGTARVYNGTVVTDDKPAEGQTANSGKIYFVTPNASGAADNVTFTNRQGETLSASECCVDLSQNQYAVAYLALRAATNKLANAVDGELSVIDFDELISKTDTEFLPSTFVYEKNCLANGNETEHACVFAFDDLDLPTHAYALGDVTLTYASSNASALTNGGKVTASRDGIQNAELTITAQKGEQTIGVTTLTVHVVDCTLGDQLLAYGKTAANALMARYYDKTESKYVFKRALQLPTSISAGSSSVTFAYEAFSDQGLTAVVDKVITEQTGVCLIEPTSSVQYLVITVNGSQKLTYAVLASDAGLVRTQASYAQDFIIQNYGGSIELRRTNPASETVPTFGSQLLYTPSSGNAHSSIVKIEYALVNDTNSLYELTGCDSPLTVTSQDGSLQVAQNKNPFDFVQTVQLNCKFYFDGTTETTEIQIPVRCSGEQSNNVNKFLPYYNEYDRMFFTNTACYTTKTFQMPFASGDSTADFVICYDMLSVITDANGNSAESWNSLVGITVSLFYDGKDHVLTATSGTYQNQSYASYVNALNEHLNELNSTDQLAAIKQILAYGDSKWVFTVYTSGANALPEQNQNFEFVYNYRNVANDSFHRYENNSDLPIGTSFTLPGILIYGGTKSNSIGDLNMYKWLYYTFRADETEYFDGQVVLTDWLKQNVKVDITVDGYGKTYLANATDLNGLQYVVGATEVNLSGKDLSANYAANMRYICQMAAVEVLNLSNCKLSVSSGNSATDPEDEQLALLSQLKNLTTLYLGNESGTTTNLNTIYSFKFLTSLPALNRVYVYNNLDSSTVGGVFYGALGLVNMEYFSELVDAGVTVYDRKGDGDALVFSQTSDINDFKTLQGIEYQKKLKEGQSIKVAYEQFDGIAQSDLGLKTSYTVGSTTYRASGTLTWGYDGDEYSATSFYVTYNLTLSSGYTSYSVAIKVVFDVVRVEVTA